jgi:hypothetical protein
MLEDYTQLLWEAAEKRRCCRIQLRGEPLPRTIDPHGVCRTSANKIVLVCWQSMGFTKPGGTAGFRNLVLENCDEIEMIDKHFVIQESFNPKDPQYREWVFHI